MEKNVYLEPQMVSTTLYQKMKIFVSLIITMPMHIPSHWSKKCSKFVII